MARSPSGKAEDCKSSIVGSIPTRASIKYPQSFKLTGFFVGIVPYSYLYERAAMLFILYQNYTAQSKQRSIESNHPLECDPLTAT